MALLIGHYKHQLDEAGRFRIPAKFKDAYVGGAVIASPNKGYLMLLPISEYEKIAEKSDAASLVDAAEQEALGVLVHDMWPLEEDNQGRMLLPQTHRDHLGNTKDITFAGKCRFVEIWPTELYEQKFGSALSADKVQSAMQKLKGLGF